jgi:glycosyltransferase involved in cell wall biosynthesis
VLLVEERGDLQQGHYAPRIRRIADGFTAAGHEVTVLTSVGLCAESSGVVDPPWALRRYGPFGRVLERLIRRPDHLPYRHRWRRPLRQITVRVRSLLILVESGLAARTLGPPDQVAVIVSGTGLSPVHAALLAPNRGRWLSYRHDRARRRTPRSGPVGTAVDRGMAGVIAWRERTRRGRGGRYVLAGTFPDLVDTWRPRLPQVAMGTVALAVAPAGVMVDQAEARRRLGLPEGPLALFFGALHPGKSADTVWSAWCGGTPLPVTLVAAGDGVASSLDAWSNRHPGADTSSVVVFDGAIHDDTKQRLFDAVDIGVLSFADQPIGASGTLGDFTTHRRPVCCSSGGHPAELVARYDLGLVFPVEDPAALAEAAVTLLDHPVPPGTFEAFEADFSESHLAEEMLRLLAMPGT